MEVDLRTIETAPVIQKHPVTGVWTIIPAARALAALYSCEIREPTLTHSDPDEYRAEVWRAGDANLNIATVYLTAYVTATLGSLRDWFINRDRRS